MSNDSNFLFACTKCHSRHPFEKLSTGEQLCKQCRQEFPLVKCTYCRLEFHLMKSTEGNPVCKKCNHNLKTYGQPKCCEYCNLRAAFIGTKCNRCISSEKKYGPPVACQQCKLKCAFTRSDDSKSKVDGKVLCLMCTMSYKRLRHKTMKISGHKRSHSEKGDSSSKQSRHIRKESEIKNSPAKVAKLSAPSRDSPIVSFSLQYGSRDSDSGGEAFTTDHMAELTELREQLVGLKKQLQQKNQAILEKDKKITELKAEQWEKDKDHRQKICGLQKENSQKQEELHAEIRSLKKQVNQLSKGSKAGT